MKLWLLGRNILVAIALLTTLTLGVLGIAAFLGREEPNPSGRALHEIRLASSKHSSFGEQGYWVADVSGLYERGLIPREIAEADAAPLTPLVPQPRPYHGYLFIALQSLPTDNPDGTRELEKGQKYSRESCAFCAFPAARGPNKCVMLVRETGFWRKQMEGGVPVLKWPTNIMRNGWWIVD